MVLLCIPKPCQLPQKKEVALASPVFESECNCWYAAAAYSNFMDVKITEDIGSYNMTLIKYYFLLIHHRDLNKGCTIH